MARTTSSVKHTHKYYKVNGLWHCSGIDGCTHYMPKNMPEPVGRKSICWKCDNEFQLLSHNMKDTHPMCDECNETLSRANKFLDMMMPDHDMDPLEKRMKDIREKSLKKAQAQIESNRIVSADTETTIHEAKEEHMSDCATSLGMECDCK